MQNLEEKYREIRATKGPKRANSPKQPQRLNHWRTSFRTCRFVLAGFSSSLSIAAQMGVNKRKFLRCSQNFSKVQKAR